MDQNSDAWKIFGIVVELLQNRFEKAKGTSRYSLAYALTMFEQPQLDALLDVMEARVEPSRLEKERAAVLSEMTMVKTIEYRVECQILSTP